MAGHITSKDKENQSASHDEAQTAHDDFSFFIILESSFSCVFYSLINSPFLQLHEHLYSFDTHLSLLLSRMVEEPPFRPREKLIEKQKMYQSIHKHTYLKGPMDRITSVAIPLALAGSSLFLIGRGIYNMSHGIGRKE
ncbi:hypothetical protein L2E82_33153 [Cichorium intybus]|uniref:Uncharacterized protein n=1 Tax=Cichorium intybus TaxID=13427 RepID=A0ACB9BJE3_CICIN|nr:hypothetical protein L2E82_33153 [Cichorium intybus]